MLGEGSFVTRKENGLLFFPEERNVTEPLGIASVGLSSHLQPSGRAPTRHYGSRVLSGCWGTAAQRQKDALAVRGCL